MNQILVEHGDRYTLLVLISLDKAMNICTFQSMSSAIV